MSVKKKVFVILSLLFFISQFTYSQKRNLTTNEKNSIQVFDDFLKFLKNSIHNRTDISDSADLNVIISRYVFTNSTLDSSNKKNLDINKLGVDQLNNLKTELNSFYQYLQEREHQNLTAYLTALPIRLSTDSFVYKKLTSFQKQNTFIYYDKRFPRKTLGYILFIPPLNNLIAAPKIWSWTLEFKFGRFVFKSVTGKEGYEYIFIPDEFKMDRKLAK